MVTTIKRGSSRKKIINVLKQYPLKNKMTDIRKYCGILRIKEDPTVLQKQWRNEWE